MLLSTSAGGDWRGPTQALRLFALVAAPTAFVVLTLDGASLAERLVALGCTGVVPLGLALAAPRAGDGETPWVARGFSVATVLLFVGAPAVIVSFVAPVGSALSVGAGGLYVLAAAAIGGLGLARLLGRRAAGAVGPLDALATDLGLLELPVAAGWLLASRAGVSPLGFHEPIVLLTAAHLHFAGFGSGVLLGAAGRLVRGARGSLPPALRFGTVAVCGSVPIVALGISTTPAIERVAALVLAGSLLVAAGALGAIVAPVARRTSVAAATLYFVASVVLLGTMGLAAAFALTGSAGHGGTLSPVVPLGTMITFHGAGNAVGFVLAGLVAATLAERR